ncbi:MAG: hypothetical protein FWC75_01795 [Oscillospiraceae bacterium]|nr:hypothetical protein [Oscillospiraceae bacterium]
MDFSKDILRYDEQAIMRLRTLYKQHGYSEFGSADLRNMSYTLITNLFSPPAIS